MDIGIYNHRVGIMESGGTETFLREIMKRLSKSHSITLYTGTGPILDEVAGMDIEVRQIPFTSGECFKFSSPLGIEMQIERELISFYRQTRGCGIFDEMTRKHDVISTHYYFDNILLSRTLEVPTLYRFPGFIHPRRWKIFSKLADTDIYVANSETVRNEIEKHLSIDINGVVYAGVDIDQFSPDTSPAFESEKITILYVGRMDKGKGLKELLTAFERVSSRAELCMVGDGELVDDLHSLSERLGIKDDVMFVGPIPHDEIQSYFAAGDIFCLPSEYESLGLVNLEAMATGTPVISTRVDAIQEYISHEKNGLLVNPGDIDAIASSFDRLIDSPSLRSKLGSAARETAEQFSWTSQARKLEAQYREAITSK